jgi:putative endonuclease
MAHFTHHYPHDVPVDVYILSCTDGTHYTGITKSLTVRLLAHAAGLVWYTRNRRPLKLLCTVRCTNRFTAAHLERQIKKRGALRWLKGHYNHVNLPVEENSLILSRPRRPSMDPHHNPIRPVQSIPPHTQQ